MALTTRFDPDVHDILEARQAFQRIKVMMDQINGMFVGGVASFLSSTCSGDLLIGDGLGNWVVSGPGGARMFYGSPDGVSNTFQFIASTDAVVSGANKLIGSDSTPGFAKEITLGTNLSMTGTTLNAAGLGDHNHTAGGDGGVLTNDDHDGFVNVQNISTPANPLAGSMRVFTRLNGGNIELISLGPLGGECVLCAKPNVNITEELQLNWVE